MGSVIRAEKGYTVIRAKEPGDKQAEYTELERGAAVIAFDVQGEKVTPVTVAGRVDGDYALRTPEGTYEFGEQTLASPAEFLAAMNASKRKKGDQPTDVARTGTPGTQQQRDQAIVSGPSQVNEGNAVRVDAFNTVDAQQVKDERVPAQRAGEENVKRVGRPPKESGVPQQVSKPGQQVEKK